MGDKALAKAKEVNVKEVANDLKGINVKDKIKETETLLRPSNEMDAEEKDFKWRMKTLDAQDKEFFMLVTDVPIVGWPIALLGFLLNLALVYISGLGTILCAMCTQ